MCLQNRTLTYALHVTVKLCYVPQIDETRLAVTGTSAMILQTQNRSYFLITKDR